MSTLTLTVLRCPEAVIAEQRQVHGGTLKMGRGPECDWSLPDPFKSLSREHCIVEFQAGGWQVRDKSANGTFVNFATSAIGRDMTQPLQDGDRLRLGAYEIEVRVEEAGVDARFGAPSAAAAAQTVMPAYGGGFGASPAAVPGLPGGGRPSFSNARLPGLDDAVDNPGGGWGRQVQAIQEDGAQRDHAPAVQGAYIPPAATPVAHQPIPEKWWESDVPADDKPAVAVGAPPTPRPVPAPVPVPAPPEPVVSPPLPTPAAPQAANAAASGGLPAGLAALAAGSGLPPELLAMAAHDPQAALHNAGALLRIAVSGLRALLIARGSVKREFRIEQTMLRPSDNNPLKFAASDEQALAALLDPRKPSLRAVQESIDDLTLHQVAALQATQAAARALLERMGPADIEAEDPGGGLLPGARDKRLWEAYKRRHAKLLEQFDDDFDSAFGTAFARAYEQAAGAAKP
jgi:type VI secretion system protein ImpI/type VI secretion system protein